MIVTPTTKTTLLLNGAYQPYKFLSARDAIYNLGTGGIRAIDAYGNVLKWDEWFTIAEHDDQTPELRSAHNTWPVPVIAIVPGFFKTLRETTKKNLSLRKTYFLYERTCQYCLKEIPFSTATKDHVIPRSKGGKNDSTNIVLACKRCNVAKGSKLNYHNCKGELPKIRNINTPLDLMRVENVKMRKEFEFFIK